MSETGAVELFVAVVDDDVSWGEKVAATFWGDSKGKNVALQ